MIVSDFLKTHANQFIAGHETVWKITPQGVPMTINAYKFNGEMPAAELITSVRGIVSIKDISDVPEWQLKLLKI